MAELKPCPFCGGKAKMEKHSFWSDTTNAFTNHTYGVQCSKCFAQMRQFYVSEKQAARDWNRRVVNG